MKYNRKNLRYSLIGFVFCLVFGLGIVSVFGQITKPNEQPKEPELIPLTTEESKIDLKNLLASQPDYAAKQNFFFSEGFGGFGASNKIAKKGNKYRTDTGFVVVISELNKPTLRLNSDKTYEESVGVRKPYVTPSSPLNPTDLLGFGDISLSALGTVTVDGNKLLKIQAKSKEFKEDVFLYVDFSRKSLITIIQVLGLRQGSIGRLQDISFDVPNELFDLSDYRAVPKFMWKRVKTAKVVYKGKLVSDAQVFRYDDFIFVHVEEFEDMLINLKTSTALTVVFQGELVSKDGSYIWRTDEDEAISIGEPGLYFKNPCKDCVKIRSDLNSTTIPDPEHKSRTLLKLNW